VNAPTLDLALADAALTPVREALEERAKRDAAHLMDRADAEIGEQLELARSRAAEILGQAREQGESDAAAYLAAERSRIRGNARRVQLAQRRAVYDRLLESSTEAVVRLREEPGYPGLLSRLSALARQVLGDAPVLSEARSGGLIATAGRRRLDLSLPELADRAVVRLGADVEELWSL
jgi:hypothetical protein